MTLSVSQPGATIVAIVDDDPSVRRGLTRLLRLAGFAVHTYSSGEAFLCCPPDKLPACAVVDIELGGLSGIELKSRLDQRQDGLPVIFMTANDDTSARIVPCLKKPFAGSLLISMIRDAVND